MRHEIVHNTYVVNDLKAKGAVFVEELEQVPQGGTVVFSAHGVSQAVRAQAQALGLQVFDATCPLVTKVHVEVAKMRRDGLEIVMIGHAGHPEVEGTMGQAEGIHLVQTLDDVARLNIAPDAPLILALPGSRRGEVSRLGPIFGAALAQVIAQKPTARIVIPTVRGVAALVHDIVKAWPGNPLVVETPDEKRAAFAAANVALAASGTVSLELAANRLPMVIAYDFNWLSRQIILRMVRVDTATLVNLVTDTRTVPEFIGAACTPANITPAVLDMLHPGPKREAQAAAMADCMVALGQGGEPPGLRAARSVLAHIRKVTP
ncbi:4-hydroxy-3-methylbut-2-enyl diphosphate reductase [mine drainage metagenome]|uniref:4-hydroxy-3-methylbut-2-enyl diphosphate reductase n=1 Tax=mine drainage metagenome TaxID=410659 RepID=A0A1J5PJN4_9ZZZZ